VSIPDIRGAQLEFPELFSNIPAILLDTWNIFGILCLILTVLGKLLVDLLDRLLV
jgi:hypothetical protein